MVTTVILGIITPTVHTIAMVPITTQARNANFQKAELQTVTFMTASMKNEELSKVPEGCTLTTEDQELQNYTITCEHGQLKQTKATASRSFSLFDLNATGSYDNPDRSFAFETPGKYSHIECPVNDPWGVMYYNDHLQAGHLDACLPAPIWSKARYLESNPDDWLYDLSDHGYGQHPDF